MLFHKQSGFGSSFPLSLVCQFSSAIHSVISILTYVSGKKWSHCSSVPAPALLAHQPYNPHNPSLFTFSHKGGLSMYSLIQSLLLLCLLLPHLRREFWWCFNLAAVSMITSFLLFQHRFDFKVLLLNSQLRVLQGKQAPAGESQAWKRTKSFWMIVGCLAVSLIYRYDYEKQNFSWAEKVKKSVEETLAASRVSRVCCRV